MPPDRVVWLRDYSLGDVPGSGVVVLDVGSVVVVVVVVVVVGRVVLVVVGWVGSSVVVVFVGFAVVVVVVVELDEDSVVVVVDSVVDDVSDVDDEVSDELLVSSLAVLTLTLLGGVPGWASPSLPPASAATAANMVATTRPDTPRTATDLRCGRSSSGGASSVWSSRSDIKDLPPRQPFPRMGNQERQSRRGNVSPLRSAFGRVITYHRP